MILGQMEPPQSSTFAIENLQLSITPENISTSFVVHAAGFSFACSIITVPKIVDGHVKLASLSVSGPISLVMSSDEMKTEVESYLDKLEDRTHRPVAKLTLAAHFIWVTLG